MKVFVAGGTGVIGRRAVPALVEAGHDLTVVARTEERDGLVERMGGTPVRVDLFDAAGLRSAVAGHDAVVNLATHIPPLSKAARAASWSENDRIRTEGSVNLADAARMNDVGRLVQESITFPYVDGGDAWVDEDTPRPASEFSASVDVAEGAALGYADGAGVVLRFAQFHAPDASHISTYARAFAMRSNPLVGDPDAYMSFIGMDAAARAVVAALTVAPGVYNIADDDPPTRRQAGAAVAEELGKGRPFHLPTGVVRRLMPSSEVLARSHRISNARFKDATGWKPDFAGGEGLARSIADHVAAR
ncbi:NAD-dependent epimerase/dehydratase family protein [Actinospongicola halichondriae]|uniref:NAD-dependent epimerase/dehydratase family protein n=1 Tax=Actinospongicola halichondriae TaxID=3236844 RepID=UPI003D50951C